MYICLAGKESKWQQFLIWGEWPQRGRPLYPPRPLHGILNPNSEEKLHLSLWPDFHEGGEEQECGDCRKNCPHSKTPVTETRGSEVRHCDGWPRFLKGRRGKIAHAVVDASVYQMCEGGGGHKA